MCSFSVYVKIWVEIYPLEHWKGNVIMYKPYLWTMCIVLWGREETTGWTILLCWIEVFLGQCTTLQYNPHGTTLFYWRHASTWREVVPRWDGSTRCYVAPWWEVSPVPLWCYVSLWCYVAPRVGSLCGVISPWCCTVLCISHGAMLFCGTMGCYWSYSDVVCLLCLWWKLCV